jgi:Tfp pilus assembly protein FimV
VPDDFKTQAPEVLHGALANDPATQALRDDQIQMINKYKFL